MAAVFRLNVSGVEHKATALHGGEVFSPHPVVLP
jgi:hypothetical protein